MSDLAEARSADVVGTQVVLVPVGAVEQHGPHLPLDTDTAIATAVARGASQRTGAWVAPALAYGSSGEHQSFAGTSSIGTEVLTHVLTELTRSLRTWAEQVVFVNAHGGNVPALKAAVEKLVHEGHRVSWVACTTEGVDLHAGRTETSLMLHIAPWNVRMHLAEVGNTNELRDILPAMQAGGVAAVSSNGVLGDPSGASAAEGAKRIQMMIHDVVYAITQGSR